MTRGRKPKEKPVEWSFEGYRLEKTDGKYRIYAGKSLLYATDSAENLDEMCRLIESRRK